ncbi:hypothetical protein GDO78_004049 [Eleutherodactylus coqui]|uniref:Uncharacterized protein n=1 Tax=Eleutherodactylus coqui TaxID=57060 RepID=A0A8J6EQK1_ELECQ|nr:hypothetical protein GDO78_004049 [Eleutherodactylus coqui]
MVDLMFLFSIWGFSFKVYRISLFNRSIRSSPFCNFSLLVSKRRTLSPTFRLIIPLLFAHFGYLDQFQWSLICNMFYHHF